jgi:hypothetical protein
MLSVIAGAQRFAHVFRVFVTNRDDAALDIWRDYSLAMGFKL